MTIIEEYYDYAKLAAAAYIDLSSTATPYDVQSIVDAGASKEQQRVPQAIGEQIFGAGIYKIRPHWTMLSLYYRTSGSTGHSDPDSGFAGMVLEHSEHGKVLAIAGTEPTEGAWYNPQWYWDLLNADIAQIGLLGAALNQIVSLYNYVQVLKADETDTNVLRLEAKAERTLISQQLNRLCSQINYYLRSVHAVA